jgi:hypothetical protein
MQSAAKRANLKGQETARFLPHISVSIPATLLINLAIWVDAKAPSYKTALCDAKSRKFVFLHDHNGPLSATSRRKCGISAKNKSSAPNHFLSD